MRLLLRLQTKQQENKARKAISEADEEGIEEESDILQ